jgi:hypothetical protein
LPSATDMVLVRSASKEALKARKSHLHRLQTENTARISFGFLATLLYVLLDKYGICVIY